MSDGHTKHGHKKHGHTLSIGDEVLWRGEWGARKPKRAKIRALESTLGYGTKHGRHVSQVEWPDMKAHVLVTLDNGHWAYGFQLEKVKQ